MTRIQVGQSFAVTVGRVIIGIVFFAHGWQKFFTNGIDNVEAGFKAMDVPAPLLSAWYAGIVELVGGGLLIVGLAVPLVSILLIIDMVGAIVTAHLDAGTFFADGGGPELPLALIGGLLAVGFAHQGYLSVDGNVLAARNRKQ
ncbi:MAG: DoxX family protein [Gordonia sp. (in: high G+C Gram-positive bacteria)]